MVQNIHSRGNIVDVCDCRGRIEERGIWSGNSKPTCRTVIRPYMYNFFRKLKTLPGDRADTFWSVCYRPSFNTLRMPEVAGLKLIKGTQSGLLGDFCRKKHMPNYKCQQKLITKKCLHHNTLFWNGFFLCSGWRLHCGAHTCRRTCW